MKKTNKSSEKKVAKEKAATKPKSKPKKIADAPKIQRRPYKPAEGMAVLNTMDTKGIKPSDILANNPIANCREDYSEWIDMVKSQ